VKKGLFDSFRQTGDACRVGGPHVSVGDRGALPAHHRPDLAALGPGVEVVAGALEGDPLHDALDTNLAQEVSGANLRQIRLQANTEGLGTSPRQQILSRESTLYFLVIY